MTVLIQSRELKLQRRELQQNRGALELQAAELHQSVEALKQQHQIRRQEISDSQKRNVSVDKNLEIQSLFDAIDRIREKCYAFMPINAYGEAPSLYLFGDQGYWTQRSLDLAENLRMANIALRSTISKIQRGEFSPVGRSKGTDELARLEEMLSQILVHAQDGDSSIARLIARCELKELHEAISQITPIIRVLPNDGSHK